MTDEPRFDISQFGGEVRRLMVVAAHPDDLETTCGGTLALLIRSGIDRRSAYTGDGGHSGLWDTPSGV